MTRLLPIIAVALAVGVTIWNIAVANQNRGDTDWPLLRNESELVKWIRKILTGIVILFVAVGLILGIVVMVAGVVRTI